VLDGVRTSVKRAGLNALTLIPIVWEEQAMGVLFLRAETHRGALTPRQMFICQVLVDATAIALRNARVLQSLRNETDSITYARLEAERRLQSLRRYADVFASSAHGIAAFDARSRVVLANPGVIKILGYQEDELLGRPIWKLIHKEDKYRLPEVLRNIMRGNFPEDYDLRVRTKSGEYRIINCSFSMLSGSEGTVLVLLRDVTESRRLNEELIRTKEFLESLLANSVDAIVANHKTGPNKGKIILFNRGAERMYRRRAEDVVNKLHVEALYQGDGARQVGRMLRTDQYGEVGRVGPIRIQALDSEKVAFPISLTAAYIYENDEPVATFGIMTDLREQVLVEQKLAQVRERLAISEKQAVVAEVAGTTAHELNQPLTSVMGYAEFLSYKLAHDPEVAKAANLIHREAGRMAEIVRKIGKLTKYETRSYVGSQRILDLDRSARDSETEADEENEYR